MTADTQQPEQQRIAAIAREVFDTNGTQRQTISPDQQHVDGRNLIVRGLDEWRAYRDEDRA